MTKILLINLPFNYFKANKFSQKKLARRVSKSQSGQALIVILAFSAILGAGLLFVYNTAQLSIAKRELVNAADASAYSGASIIAQGLNYTAYTNRAILANNALIGQMMGIRSTLSMSERYWANTETFWATMEVLAGFVPVIGPPISRAAGGIKQFARVWGGDVVNPTKVLAEVLQVTGTAAIGLTNQVMWLSQQVHLADSLAGFEPNMIAIAKKNAPNAKVDKVLHATLFGPIVTLGMFASQFKPKIRASSRTLGTKDESKDEYLNYVTGTNRNVATSAYVGGRSLIPNAIGLWMGTGCGTDGILSAVFKPPAGVGSGIDEAVRIITVFASFLSPVANLLMCTFDRHGGSELVQLDNGKMAWVAIDVMALKIPFPDYIVARFPLLLPILPILKDIRIPFAGGATMSFTEPGKSNQSFPDSLRKFETYVYTQDERKYMGHQVALPADCVEYLRPGSWDLYAISKDSRTSGDCAVLATGFGNQMVDGGLWNGYLSGTTVATIRSSSGGGASNRVISTITRPLVSSMSAATSDLQAAMSSSAAPTNKPATGQTNQAPPGISGGVNSATTGLPNIAGLIASGQALSSSSWMNGGSRAAILGLTQRLNLNNFKVNPGSVASSSVSIGGVDGLIPIPGLSDGVETPRSPGLNRVFNVLADGLPPFFWDVRIQDNVQNAKAGEEEDLVFTDDNPDDYNPRRYNLGPLVYLPLVQDMEKIKTAENLGVGGKILGLPDFDEKPNVMRAIGKARIFFRQPADQWSYRYKVIVNTSLLLPYWQVRNESLSYVDKLTLTLITSGRK